MELPGPLVSPEWLAERLGSPGLVVADVRWVPDGTGRAQHAKGHIPGAVYLDIDADLAGTVTGPGGRHPLPQPDAWAETMANAGIGDDDAVVVYDAARGSHAVRLWWMLTATGRRSAVLDGGLEAWNGPFETGSVAREPATFTARPWPVERLADADTVAREVAAGEAILLDARAPERYRGEVEPIDPVAGHIPGARNFPWTENLDPATGRFLPPEELRRRLGRAGARDGSTTICSCGSGVTGVHDILAAVLAGLDMPRLYVGSWSDWISDPSRPIATAGHERHWAD